MFNFFKNRSKIYVKKFSAEDGSLSGALVSFNGNIRDTLIQRLKENYNTEGTHIKNGGAISPQSMLTLLGSGGGALGMSSVMSGQLFMATANVGSLMVIGNGVGSAVMGAGGIIAQAPFIPIAGALMPVLGPLLAFQAITTIMVMKEFKGIHTKLDHIEKSITRVIQRSEATFVGDLISALNRVNELESQFGICRQFTREMVIRLCLLEDKVNSVFERYKFLYESQGINRSTTKEELKFKENDAYLAILLSIIDLRVDLLRLKLAIQENPRYMRHSANRLIEKTSYYNKLWAEIAKNPKAIEAVSAELHGTIENMNWWQKNMPSWLFGGRKERGELAGKATDFEEHAEAFRLFMAEKVSDAQQVGNSLRKRLAETNQMNLIYWRDELGEHSYYTDDINLVEAGSK